MSSDSLLKPMRERFADYIISLQDEIVCALEKLDPSSPLFRRDSWVRPEGGQGVSCIFSVQPGSPEEASSVIEKAGINQSTVYGLLPPAALKQMQADHSTAPFEPNFPTNLPFFAANFALVIHPRNPNAPTAHANFRYLEITEPVVEGEVGPGKILAWWFGGLSDLSPSYLFEEDAKHFHKTLKDACDEHGADIYPAFKKWCDEYFYLPHRNEARGIGGIFFDGLSSQEHKYLDHVANRPQTPEDIFRFVKSLGNTFIPSFIPILERRMSMPSDEGKRRWQLIRRGRYVEFNLVYDRGTKFGLMTPGGKVEAILMTLPETARWEYRSDMGGDGLASEEGKLIEVLKHPRDWA